MESPKCKICGGRHRLSEGCVVTEAEIALEGKMLSPLITTVHVPPDTLLIELPPYPPTFDRVAYQRDYMRKRRAKP